MPSKRNGLDDRQEIRRRSWPTSQCAASRAFGGAVSTSTDPDSHKMGIREWSVVATCCVLLGMVTAAAAAEKTFVSENRDRTLPARGTRLGLDRVSTVAPGGGYNGTYSGPAESSPALARTLPHHCNSSTESPAPAGPPAAADKEQEDTYVPFAGQRLDMFDWRLVRELDRFARRNAVVSPVGVKLVLGLLHEAASRASATELRRALGLPAARPSARDLFRRILQTLEEKQQGYIMKVCNRVYLDQSYQPRTNIVKIYKSYYNADIERIDFTTPAVVKPIINSWVSNFTNGLINNLITNDKQVANLITMVLNVIYFKGDWLYPFAKRTTSAGPFYVDSENTVTVDYMYMTRDLYYAESEKLDAKMLRLPYKGRKYSMFFILPNKQGNFEKMVQLITPALVREQLHSLNKTEVKVKLPKFTFQYTVHLKELLEKLGISRIFTESDEINLTINKTNMKISKVIQKVGLEVNEQGTEATSVTEVDIENHFGGPTMFMVTHPFLFFVEEEKTGTIVFIGKVIDPSYVKSVRPSTPSPEDASRVSGSSILEKDFSKDITVQTADKITPPVAPSESK